MALKNRPRSAKQTFGQQGANFRRGAPGNQFVGDAAPQRERAKREERQKVERMVEVDAAVRRADELSVPVVVVLAELAQDFLKLIRSLATAPFRIAHAVRQARNSTRSPIGARG